MSTPEEIADALDAAADYIEVHGWCQNHMADAEGRVCLYGALIYSNPAATAPLRTLDAAYEAVSARAADEAITWNDQHGRTEFEVIDALRLCAKALRPVELPDPHNREADEMLAERYER